MKSNINILRTVISYVSHILESSAPKNLKGLFNLDTELHKIQLFLLQLSVEDSNLTDKPTLTQDDKTIKGLKIIKSLINLSKYRINYVHDSAFICIDILNSTGLITPSLNIPPGAASKESMQKGVLKGFLSFCQKIPNIAENETLNLELTFDLADNQDTQRIADIYSLADEYILTHGKNLKNRETINSIMSKFKSIAVSSKVGNLMLKSLKGSEEYLDVIDETILSLHYEGNDTSKLIKINPASINKNKILGEGLMGSVVVGKIGQTSCAFKFLNVNKTFREKLTSEARNELMTELRLKWMKHSNENILQLHGVTLRQNSLIIAYELMQTDLETVLHGRNKQIISTDSVSQITLGISKGLRFLHLNSVIHASLHPGNILIRGLDNVGKLQKRNISVKLTDFGTQQLKIDLTKQVDKLLALKLKTTRAYNAPEILTDNKFTYASDVYALAIVCWELAQDNERPFSRLPDLHTAVVKQKLRPNLSEGNLNPWLRELIKKCWAHEPWLRPTSAETKRSIEHEMAFAEANSGMQDFRGRPLAAPAPNTLQRLTLNSAALNKGGANRQSGSRLSRFRASVQRPMARPTSQARNSVLFQEAQKFAFLDGITQESETDVAIKVLKAMRFYGKDAELQVKCLVSLRRMLGVENRETIIGRMGAGLLAIRAIQNHLKEAAVVEPAIDLIANLCIDLKVAEALMKSGASQAVLSGILQHDSDEAVVELAFMAFTNLHQGNPERQQFIIEVDAPRAILKAMKVQEKSPSALREGFATISYLHPGWYDNKTPSKDKLKSNKSSKRGSTRAGKAKYWKDFYCLNAHDQIYQGIKTFKEDRALQSEGFNALAILAAGFKDRKKAMVKQKFLLPHIQKMLVRHKQYPEVLEAAFALLAQLVDVQECRKEVLALEIHVNIIQALATYTEAYDETLQLAGVKAMYRLCKKYKKACRVLRGAGAIESAIRAKTLYPDNLELSTTGQALSTTIARGG